MKRFVYLVMFLILAGQAVYADEKKSVENLIRTRLDGVLSILQKKDLEDSAQKQEILKIVEPVFNFKLMAKLAMGKKYWSGLTKNEQSRYTELFTRRLKDSYLEKMMLYEDEKIKFLETIQAGKKIHVPTVLVTKEQELTMLYKLYRAKAGWLIYDIEIQGVSLITTYKSQFEEIMTTGNISDLIHKLENPEKQK